mgnify:CR=1 FL=1
MNYLTAVIPVRKNSQRVKRKNFKKFNNENLLIHKIKKSPKGFYYFLGENMGIDDKILHRRK